MGRLLILIGFIFILTGLLINFFPKYPFLPGDIFVKKENFVFIFPITTSIVLSIVISLILYFFNR